MDIIDDNKYLEISNQMKFLRAFLVGMDIENFRNAMDVVYRDLSQYEALGIIDGHDYFDKVEQKRNQYEFMKALQTLYEANKKITNPAEFEK